VSEHDTHHEHGGGHELDVMPNRRLFNLLTSLTALTLMACIGLVAFFYRQADTLRVERAQEGSFLAKQYREEVREVAEGYGPTGDGQHFFVPHEKAKELVLSDPSRFKAAPPPPGWIHPDDLQGGGAPKVRAAQPAPSGTGAATGGDGQHGAPGVTADGPAGAEDAGAKAAGGAPGTQPNGAKAAGAATGQPAAATRAAEPPAGAPVEGGDGANGGPARTEKAPAGEPSKPRGVSNDGDAAKSHGP